MRILFKSLLTFSKAYIFIFVAFITLFLVEIFLNGYELSRFFNLIENIAFTSTLFAITNLLISSRKIVVPKMIYVFIFLIVLIEGLYFISFKAEVSSSAIFIGLDSNSNEVGEFFKFNFKWQHAVFVISLVANFVFSWIFFPPNDDYIKTKQWYFFQLVVITLGISLLTKERINQYNFPNVLYRSVNEYNKERILINQLNANRSPFEEVQAQSKLTAETHIVVIGESTSRLHFGLYGYGRQTTPQLQEIVDELDVFDNVVSGETYTVGSLVKALMIEDKNTYVGNVLQLFNQAGYQTYWLSNQPPIGIYETLVTKIALSANYSQFMTTESPNKRMNYDEVLLAKLDAVLKEPASKKIIFLHLMGTHANYKYRYPKSFDIFSTNDASEKQQIRDQYDNAVLYNDYILREIIEKTRRTDIPSSVIYFSDHGEEVYDSIDFAGHPVNGQFTYNLIEIPFLHWNSSNKEIPKQFFNRPFILNDLSHSLADLYEIKSKQTDTTRSVFSKAFKIRQRIVRDTIIVE